MRRAGRGGLTRRGAAASIVGAALSASTAVALEPVDAVVIGNADYATDGFPVLIAADKDPLLVAAALSADGRAVDVIVNGDRARLFSALARLRARPRGLRIVYATGHGIADAQGDQLFVRATPQPVAVTLSEIVAAVADAHAPVLVLWDACRDNPFGAEVSDAYQPALPPGVGVFFSTRAGTQADDTLGDAVHTEFAMAVDLALRDRALTVAQLVDIVAARVARATGGRQQTVLAGDLRGDTRVLQ